MKLVQAWNSIENFLQYLKSPFNVQHAPISVGFRYLYTIHTETLSIINNSIHCTMYAHTHKTQLVVAEREKKKKRINK